MMIYRHYNMFGHMNPTFCSHGFLMVGADFVGTDLWSVHSSLESEVPDRPEVCPNE